MSGIDWQARAEAAEARLAAFEAVVGPAKDWLSAFADADLDELAADGGVTVGMVFQQEARTVLVPRLRALSEADKDRQIAQGHEEEGGGR